jgi:hypothetical protein
VTQQVRIVESHGKKAAILQLLHEAGLMTPGSWESFDISAVQM